MATVGSCASRTLAAAAGVRAGSRMRTVRVASAGCGAEASCQHAPMVHGGLESAFKNPPAGNNSPGHLVRYRKMLTTFVIIGRCPLALRVVCCVLQLAQDPTWLLCHSESPLGDLAEPAAAPPDSGHLQAASAPLAEAASVADEAPSSCRSATQAGPLRLCPRLAWPDQDQTYLPNQPGKERA